MFDLSNYSDYDRWLNAFTEASVRLDALDTAVTQVRHLCEGGGSPMSKSSKCLNVKAYNLPGRGAEPSPRRSRIPLRNNGFHATEGTAAQHDPRSTG